MAALSVTRPPGSVWRMALSSRLRTTRIISAVATSTTGAGSWTSQRRSSPLARADTVAPAMASDSSSSSITGATSSSRASDPDRIRDSSKRSSTRPARWSASNRIVA